MSKLPDVGTTIFTVMSRRALEHGALNIGQGFPDYPIDAALVSCVVEAMAAGHDQYAPMEGVIALREAIAAKLHATQGIVVDPVDEITVTSGGTEALYSAIQAFVGPGDECVIFDPAYDSYEPAIRLAGGTAVRIPLAPPSFRYDWDRVRSALSVRTKLVIINNPLNPACTVAAQTDLDVLASVLRDTGTLVLADEVYEHVVFDGRRHHSVLAHAELAARSLAVFSFGKTLHATGWRVGYCVAPAPLTLELRKVHQFNTFSVVCPLQHAIASYLASKPSAWLDLGDLFQAKRDRFMAAIAGSGFVLRAAEGTYFQLLDYSAFGGGESDIAFADRLIREASVATIPLSAFYAEPPANLAFIRVCIAKRDETLDLAARRLRSFSETFA